MSETKNLMCEWQQIRERAGELHRMTGLSMYEKIVRKADDHLGQLTPHANDGRKAGGGHA